MFLFNTPCKRVILNNLRAYWIMKENERAVRLSFLQDLILTYLGLRMAIRNDAICGRELDDYNKVSMLYVTSMFGLRHLLMTYGDVNRAYGHVTYSLTFKVKGLPFAFQLVEDYNTDEGFSISHLYQMLNNLIPGTSSIPSIINILPLNKQAVCFIKQSARTRKDVILLLLRGLIVGDYRTVDLYSSKDIEDELESLEVLNED